jgi:hypothetical protein
MKIASLQALRFRSLHDTTIRVGEMTVLIGANIVVIASGETGRAALPVLVEHLGAEGITLSGSVRTPPRHRQLHADEVAWLVKAAHFSSNPRPDGFVVLIDADPRDPIAVASALQSELVPLCSGLAVPMLVTAAKWHLEAWFFADAPGLRAFVGRDLGAVDASKPDDIDNPKLHLKNLLGRTYTARVAGDIARALSVSGVRASPSYRRFEAALRNGAEA